MDFENSTLLGRLVNRSDIILAFAVIGIVGVLITMINVIGGFVIGIVMQDSSAKEALRKYTLLSIGDGLVTQIPVLIVSTAAGIIVTRAASTSNMGRDLTTQLIFQPTAIMIAAAMLNE